MTNAEIRERLLQRIDQRRDIKPQLEPALQAGPRFVRSIQSHTLADAFVGDVLTIPSALGDLRLGAVDTSHQDVARAISALLMSASNDFRESRGGHLPDVIAAGVQETYLTVTKVRELYAKTGVRFAMLLGNELVATLLVAKDHDTILIKDRFNTNVSSARNPGFKPDNYHQIFNLAVNTKLRRAKLATLLFDAVTTHFREQFAGAGLWMRGDPPWHERLLGLGFRHDPSMDVFLDANAPRTRGLEPADFNRAYACDCVHPEPSAPDALRDRPRRFTQEKLKYHSFTRDF
jgi:hypothetical protein